MKKPVFGPSCRRQSRIDFGEARGVIGGVERKTHFFAMDLPHSDGCLVQACPVESSEAFCEGHRVGFEFFCGVPRSIVYDNLKLAVAGILRDGRRLRIRSSASRSRTTCFADRLLRPRKGNDKGKVKGWWGARCNFMVPIPNATSFDHQLVDVTAYQHFAVAVSGGHRIVVAR